MVIAKRSTLASVAAALVLSMFAAEACARVIKKVTIEQIGLNSNPNDEMFSRDCKHFRPTVAQVKNFFSKAYSVPRRWAINERYAPCYATGSITFDDFGPAKWSISSGGVGSLSWTEGDDVYLFYKHNKWADPTACSYGMGDDLAC
ncbi:hypothetical protein WKW77_19775 [Variovorax ureilyticus]|uniref:Uncharacterized protein n=1 Tax=Variovorax ureilyticus TaxID=1836198 RepID=A0ABU8VI45_9BURK